MGDDLVDAVLASVKDNCFANGLPVESVRPVIDAIVNRLRVFGLDDNLILLALVEGRR